jgi:methyl coenzyme M reductase alpha subunit
MRKNNWVGKISFYDLSAGARAGLRLFPNKVVQQAVNFILRRFRWMVWITGISTAHLSLENKIGCEGNPATIWGCSARN